MSAPSDLDTSGIRVTESGSMDQAIELQSATCAAFVGRALRGPLNTPVPIDCMATFARRFGGVWQRSSLGPAVAQFFAHGGRQLYVVRVANNARGAMICLPAHHGVLVLRALEPGSTEQIRAAVDYDGIPASDAAHFNLTVQRLSPASGLVIDQEIYRRVSCAEDDRTFIGDALTTSSLIVMQLPLPAGRPAATMGRNVDAGPIYVEHAQRGSDGADLSDYDLIGSATAGTGLFALEPIDRLDLVYLPPPARARDVGPAALLAAELYCRRRGALLVMDPPAAWSGAAEAVAGMKQSGYRSPNVLSYFPRLADAGSGEDGGPAGGAIAGLLCKLDAGAGPWASLESLSTAFSRELHPLVELTRAEIAALNRAGLNAVAGARAMLRGDVTLGCGTAADRQFASLPARRLCLAITNTLERATRWAVFDADDGSRVAERVRQQVDAYLRMLAEAGAFADARYSVQCEAVPAAMPAQPFGSLTVLLAFRPSNGAEPVTLTLQQTIGGCRVAATAFAPVAACA